MPGSAEKKSHVTVHALSVCTNWGAPIIGSERKQVTPARMRAFFEESIYQGSATGVPFALFPSRFFHNACAAYHERFLSAARYCVHC